MKVHIVQVNENLRDIARKYNISVEDIIKNNQHISHARHILPGMKLKLPILSEEANIRFRDQMLQIQDYYPTLEDFEHNDKLKPENNANQGSPSQQTSQIATTPSYHDSKPTYPQTQLTQPTQPQTGTMGQSIYQPQQTPYIAPNYGQQSYVNPPYQQNLQGQHPQQQWLNYLQWYQQFYPYTPPGTSIYQPNTYQYPPSSQSPSYSKIETPKIKEKPNAQEKEGKKEQPKMLRIDLRKTKTDKS